MSETCGLVVVLVGVVAVAVMVVVEVAVVVILIVVCAAVVAAHTEKVYLLKECRDSNNHFYPKPVDDIQQHRSLQRL